MCTKPDKKEQPIISLIHLFNKFNSMEKKSQ